MKKTLSLIIAMGMLLGLVACGSSGAQAPADSQAPAEEAVTEETPAAPADDAAAPAEDDGKVHITYCFWGAEEEAKNTQAVVDIFNAEQDRIVVECMVIPWETYMEKLNTMATGGNLPDTALMSEAATLKWANEGLLLDLTDMYGPDDPKPLGSATFTSEGKPVAYAVANNTLELFYNKDMFDAAGLPYPSANADEAYTWDEFVDVAKTLTLDKNGKNAHDPDFDPDNIVQYGCMVENLTWQLEVWCRSNGSGFYNEDGTEVTINDEAAIEAIQAVADLYLVHHCAPLSTGLTDDGVQRSLIAGTCAMTTNGVWNIGTCLAAAREEGLNYGLAVLPYMKEKVTIATGGPNVIFNQTKHPEEAMEWIRWYSKEENNWDALISTGIWAPVLGSYYEGGELTDKWLKNPNFPEYEEAKGVLVDYVNDYAVGTSWNYTPNTDDFNTLLGSILGDVWTGKTTAKEAIESNYDALVAAREGF